MLQQTAFNLHLVLLAKFISEFLPEFDSNILLARSKLM